MRRVTGSSGFGLPLLGRVRALRAALISRRAIQAMRPGVALFRHRDRDVRVDVASRVLHVHGETIGASETGCWAVGQPHPLAAAGIHAAGQRGPVARRLADRHARHIVGVARRESHLDPAPTTIVDHLDGALAWCPVVVIAEFVDMGRTRLRIGQRRHVRRTLLAAVIFPPAARATIASGASNA
jgi:hypothetical protein